MPDKDQKFDEAFKRATYDFEKPPSLKVWTGIHKLLVIKKVLGLGIFKSSRLIYFYCSVLLVGITVFAVYSYKNARHSEIHKTNNQLQIAKTIHDSLIIQKQSEGTQRPGEARNPVAIAGNQVPNPVQGTVIPNKSKEKQPKGQTVMPGIQSTITGNSQTKNSQVKNQDKNLISQEVNNPVATEKNKIAAETKPAYNNPDSEQTGKGNIQKSPGADTSSAGQSTVIPVNKNPPLKKSRQKLEFKSDIYLIPSLSFINYLAGDSLASTAYAILRKNTEKTGFSYSAAILPGISYGKYFLQSGLIYNNNRNKVNHQVQWWRNDSNRSIWIYSIWIRDSMGGHYIYDSVPVTRIDSTRLSSQLKNGISYQYLEIPVIFGYTFEKGKWSYRLSGGFSYGFYLDSRGRIVSPAGDSLVQYTKSNFPFKKNPVPFLFLLGAEYKLNDHTSIITGANFKYQLNKLFDDPVLVNQKYLNMGLMLGLSYKF